MFIKKHFFKMTSAILVILCITISAVVFYSDKEPVEPAKTERQLRDEVLQRHLESKGRPPRIERKDAEPVTADIYVVDSNTTLPAEIPEDAIIVTSPEDINSAIADYLSRREPNDGIRMVNISEILEANRLTQRRSKARNRQIISDERINKIIEQGIRDGVFVAPSQRNQQFTNSTITQERGVFGAKGPSRIPAGIRPSVYPRTSSKHYKGPAAIMGGYSETGFDGFKRPSGIILIQPSDFVSIDIELSELTGNKSLAERLKEIQKIELKNIEELKPIEKKE